MQISWLGQACFQILTSPEKGERVSIIIDPFAEDIGLKLPKLSADILLITHQHKDHNNLKKISGNYFLIEKPGEYEIKNVFIQGIPSFHDNSFGKERGENIIFTIESEDLRICHLGDLGQKELSEEQLENIGEVDILMIPVGGVYTISAKEAFSIMNQLEPKITIPMHFKIKNLKIELEGIEKFLKILGIKKIEPIEKLSIKKKDLNPDEAKIVLLKP